MKKYKWLVTRDDAKGKEVFRREYTKFNQEKIQFDFDYQISIAGEKEAISFYNDCNHPKFYGGNLCLLVEIIDGKPTKTVIKGSKTFLVTYYPETEKSELVLHYLLENKANRANAIDLHGLPFQIGIYRADAGFLVATAYRDGKKSKRHTGLILSRDKILSWLEDSKAEIPQNAEAGK